MDKYIQELNAINGKIAEFNEYLLPKFRAPIFELGSAFENKHIVKVVHGDWNAFPFPNNGTRGVYFIFGYEQTKNEKNGLYIGKSSFNSSTSSRLYAHLHPSRAQDFFTFKGYHDENYIVEYMASIDLDILNTAFLSSALEEFLITSLQSKLNLLNGTGN